MADFDLTQTDQQVQNILNDGQSAMGAGAQTTLTTEYVMLKDTNGVYHKILKSSFTEAIRDVLAGLLVNNDKGTTISQIAAIASGDFGSITPANLASVLGAVNQFYFSQITLDMTKYTQQGQFQDAFKEWYSRANQGNYCCYISFHGQSMLFGRVVSPLYGGFIIIGYSGYANSIITLSNGTWTFKSLN